MSLLTKSMNNVIVVQTPNQAFKAWICTGQLIKSWIFETLTEEVLGYIQNLATSQYVYLSLITLTKNSIARKFDRCSCLHLLSNKGKSYLLTLASFIQSEN